MITSLNLLLFEKRRAGEGMGETGSLWVFALGCISQAPSSDSAPLPALEPRFTSVMGNAALRSEGHGVSSWGWLGHLGATRVTHLARLQLTGWNSGRWGKDWNAFLALNPCLPCTEPIPIRFLSWKWKWSPTLWDPVGCVAHQALPSMGFSRQEYWSGLPFLSPGDLPDSGIEPRSPTLQADALTSEPPGILILRTPQMVNLLSGRCALTWGASPTPGDLSLLQGSLIRWWWFSH